MDTIRKLEVTVAKWYESVPHLPKEARTWLAENAWWITAIGVIVGAIGIVSALFFTVLTGAFLAAVAGGVGAAIGALVFIGVLISLVLSAVAVFLGGMAINPLKAMKKKGWTLLFAILLLEVASIVVSNVLGMNLFALVWSLLWAAVGGYFLFELRSYFGETSSRKDRKKVDAHQKA
jgi:hypothetical protein